MEECWQCHGQFERRHMIQEPHCAAPDCHEALWICPACDDELSYDDEELSRWEVEE